MKEKNDRREIIAKAHNVTSAIKKKLAIDEENIKIDLSNIAEKLADRREKVLAEEGK
jgi:hypothetical protein